MTTSTIRRTQRPANWKAAAPDLPSTVTFAAQSKLPKLPVPLLSDTLGRLKESLKPIAWSDAEFQQVSRKIDEFGVGKGAELHERLLKHNEKSRHWLEQWWDDTGYMGYRDSVIINISYYYGFDSQPVHLPQSPAGRAATIARGAMLFRQQVKQGLVTPEATKEGPICMDTYRWMFDCCRVPGIEGLDWGVSHAKKGETGNTGHIIVMRKNRFWKVHATHKGRILGTNEFEKQIQYIYDNTTEEYPGVGILTASNRDIWAKDYNELISTPKNAQVLHEIQSAAFIISLDESKPSDFIHHSRALWHGDIVNNSPRGLRNRWSDKPVNFVVFDNSQAGLIGEHSVMDGTPTVRMCDDVLDLVYSPTFDHGASVSSDTPTPEPLSFEISSAATEAIAKADTAARELIESHDMNYHLTKYGKAAIKKFKVSPDSWAQMVVQLAFRRLLGEKKRYGGTYEAATTRKFYKGRTEAIRVVTSEADAWVESMDDKNATNEERKRLFDAATKMHVVLAKAGGNAQGVDRHMFGLKSLLQSGEETPELFNDPVFQRSSYWVLSTSAIFSKHFPVYGWGEVVPDGFGVAYMTGFDDYLQYTITSRKEMPNAEFVNEIAKAAEDVYDLHVAVRGRKAKL
ncbi:carnitine acetyl transferase [Macrolepiota fuliginosa MF-IS2]|uniref:Carnitine acetyl transferase n=1 Tax=Macrolepiota fuliginosa MF-IS2 TaxID=1400762 RepID=A0A9P5XLF6_9AGAR|nr:carnitine acetyl transferase [Macrolepiota fuliginosa MF-IS2]